MMAKRGRGFVLSGGTRHRDSRLSPRTMGRPHGHRYGVKYWEIGNEVYGDGTYGATWEVNRNAQNPSTYANGVVSFSTAMKAVDPTIKIGVVLTAPGNWPDGQTSATSPQPWNDTVLPIACSAIDFAVLHWYAQNPTGESDAALLASPEKGESTSVSYTPDIPRIVAGLKSKLAEYCGGHERSIEIMVTETNSVSYNPGKQTTSLVNALFLSDQVMTWLENGVVNVDWWAIHNSPFDGNVDPSLFGTLQFGDFGILSRGLTTANGVKEPPAETPFPTYYGLQMLAHLLQPGHLRGRLLRASSSSDLVSVHAVRRANGGVNAMLINKDPNLARPTRVSLPGVRVHGLAQVFSYGMGSASISRSARPVAGSSFDVTLPPYSAITIQLP